MKLSKAITLASLAVILIEGVLLASLPLRFPNSRIFWGPAIIFLIPALALLLLLVARPFLAVRPFRILLILAALLAIAAALVNWVAPVILCLFLIALGALYVQGDSKGARNA